MLAERRSRIDSHRRPVTESHRMISTFGSVLLLCMNAATKFIRQVFVTALVLLAAVWASGEGAQWLLRRRAQDLLADVRSLDVNRSGWPDAQRLMTKWGAYAAAGTGPCTLDACTYRIDLLQVLPQSLIGY